MGAYWLHDLPDWCADAGLEYRTWHGWEQRSRSSGGYDKLWAVIVHHTASNTSPDNDCSYMWDSTSGDQPIGAVLLERSGRVTIGAAGATNCAGKGGPMSTSHGTIPLDKGNAYAFNIEAANAGTGERWADDQLDAYAVFVAMLCERLGLDPVHDVASHFEWAPDRKIDPAGPDRYASGGNKWDMGAFRYDVAHCDDVAPPEPGPEPPRPPTQPKGQAMYAAIMKYGGKSDGGWGGWYSPDGCTTRYPVRDGQHAKALVAMGAVDGATLAVVTDPEWDGVSHTQSEGDLSAYLGEPA